MDRIHRHLVIDPLEQRQLLSVTPHVVPTSPFEHLVNETYCEYNQDSPYSPFFEAELLANNLDQTTYASQSIAVDDDGDFVIVWSRNDPVTDANGDLVDKYGNTLDGPYDVPLTDQNIYARYFTDEVQRITLPADTAIDNGVADHWGTFSVTVGGNETQKLTISETAMPYLSNGTNIVGEFKLVFDANGNNVLEATEEVTVQFNESYPEANALSMQTQLRGMGGLVADIEVTALSSQEYIFQFGDQSGGLNQPLIQINHAYTTYDPYSDEFLPGVVFETLNEPITISNITIDPDNPEETADVMEMMFEQTVEYYLNSDVDTEEQAYPHYNRITESEKNDFAQWGIEVRPVSGSSTQFDVTFTGIVSKTNVPLMTFAAITNDLGTDYLNDQEASIVTIKEPSPEFQVNNPDPQSSGTPYLDYTDQTAPAVAIDADGDFVITWQSEVAGSTSSTNSVDIYARRFTPVAYSDNPTFEITTPAVSSLGRAEETAVIGSVIPLGDQFVVNTITTDVQDQPAIGMDNEGNFVITWVNTAQDLSYFNNVSAQRYNRDGERIGGEFIVAGDAGTNVHLDPAVSLSDDGHILFTWTETDDVNYITEWINDPDRTDIDWIAGTGWAKLYTSDMQVVDSWTLSQATWQTSSTFDAGNNFLITGGGTSDPDTVFGGSDMGVYVCKYTIDSDDQGVTPAVGWRDQNNNPIWYRANSSSTTLTSTDTTPDWPLMQMYGQVMVDADGDVIVTYEGYGPDVTEYLILYARDFADVINSEQNADLLQFIDTTDLSDSAIVLYPVYATDGGLLQMQGTGDLEAEIERVILEAYQAGATWEQMGRLRSAIETKTSLFRGDPNGVMYTRLPASSNSAENVIESDVIVNTDRSGTNERYIITFPKETTGGSTTVEIVREWYTSYYDPGTGHGYHAHKETVALAPVIVDGIIDPYLTCDALETTLNDAAITGIARQAPYIEGPIEVRLLNSYSDYSYDWTIRDGTPWDYDIYGLDIGDTDYVYEITFQGSSHDTAFQVYTAPGGNDLSPDNLYSTIYEYMEAESGTAQSQQSAGMTPDGSFVVAWTQYENYSDGSCSNTNIYFREYESAYDTAGPRVTEFLLPDGDRLQDGDQIKTSLQNIVVTFDEELATSGDGSVLDPDNWALMKYDNNGDLVEVRGGITEIDFGMNKAADLAGQLGLNPVGTNKWEAVLTLDANGTESGTVPLEDGSYVIVAKSALKDPSANPLGHTGYTVNGFDILTSFTISIPTGNETTVNSELDGVQQTLDPDTDPNTIDEEEFPNSPQSVAGDADGECVVVWADDGSGLTNTKGIYAKIYPITWIEDAEGQRQSFQGMPREIEVTDDMAGVNIDLYTYASVARDGDGDFVVTWSAKDDSGDWNVWYRTFDAAGNPTSDSEIVNSELEGYQQFSTVAMDNDGDFVITWQSQAQDGSGYGIYAQRFTPDGQNELQTIEFIDADTSISTFKLKYNYQNTVLETNEIIFDPTAANAMSDLVQDIQAELNLLGFETEVYVVEGTKFGIYFKGQNGYEDISVVQVHFTTPNPPDVEIKTETNGKSLYNKLGGVNEVHAIELKGDIDVAVFSLNFDHGNTNIACGEVTYHAHDPNVEDPLQKLIDDLQAEIDLLSEVDAEVFKFNETTLAIRYIGVTGCEDRPPILFDSPPTIVGEPGSELKLSTLRNGETNEFLVSETTQGDQMWPSVAMDYAGEFVVTWTSFGQGSDDPYESNVYARKFAANEVVIEEIEQLEEIDLGAGTTDTSDLSSGMPLGNEFLVNIAYENPPQGHEANDPLDGNQKWSSVAMDADGDFVITWTGYGQDGAGNGYGPGYDGVNGIFARRFPSNAGESNTAGTVVSYDVFQVNTFVQDDQQHSTVAMDTDGDFVITWESYQEKPEVGMGADAPDSFGIYAQRYVSNDKLGTNEAYGENGEDGGEFHVNTYEAGDQRFPAVTIDDTGDVVIVWNSATAIDIDGGIFLQRFEKPQDDAGPRVTEVEFVATLEGGLVVVERITNGSSTDKDITQLIITFSEDLDTEYLEYGSNSILNPENWDLCRLMSSGATNPIEDAITNVSFGRNEANSLGLVDTVTNKYQAVISIDYDPEEAAVQVLPQGDYVLTIKKEVQDLFENAIQTNSQDLESDYEFTFSVKSSDSEDTPLIPGDSTKIKDGRTYPESPSAVATDGDGDYVAVWTAYDINLGVDRAFMMHYSAEGAPLWSEPQALTPADFGTDSQRYVTVACDPDGDFVVTWTNYRDEDGSDVNGQEQIDIYARRFSANGDAQGEAFRVNTYTAGDQLWSNVAMDAEGNFVITWSSDSQENNGMPGYGYGVYARLYDAYGYALNTEFQVNTTTGGDQQFSSVAMAADGTFVIAWQSDQNGVGNDIVCRTFNPDGSAKISPLGGEYIVNDIRIGDQTYPDVSLDLAGEMFVITWTSTQATDDPNGSGVYTKMFEIITLDETNVSKEYQGDSIIIPHAGTIQDETAITINQSFIIEDVNVTLNIQHNDPSDLRVWLVGPDGTQVELFSWLRYTDDEYGVSDGPNGANITNTTFDDAADTSIGDTSVEAPYTGTYSPMSALAAFNNTNAFGDWKLKIQDTDPEDDPDEYILSNEWYILNEDGGLLVDWSIDFVRKPDVTNETLVNSTTTGNQAYSSVDMDYQGNFIVTWSGYGDQEDEEDTSDYGVFTQQFNMTAQKVGGEQRVNRTTIGRQWISSVGVDAQGSYVTIWSGVASTSDTSSNVFIRKQNAGTGSDDENDKAIDASGPLVGGIYDGDYKLFEGEVLTGTVDQLTVTFDEALNDDMETSGSMQIAPTNSVLNTDNWIIRVGGSEILNGITEIDYGYNPNTGKYEATVYFDGNGDTPGSDGLTAGIYELILRDTVEDLEGNQLDGDYNSIPGADASTIANSGINGYCFSFNISDTDDRFGPEVRANENTELVQLLGEAKGTGQARETSVRSTAVDNNGDYVVVWTSTGQDDQNDPDGKGVYFQLYNADGTEKGVPVRANNITTGHQQNASVAMDAAGDFVIVWESEQADGTYDIYSQRFGADGSRVANDREDRIDDDPLRGTSGFNALDAIEDFTGRDLVNQDIEVLVNTTKSHDQINAEVAVDSFGNYAITWASAQSAYGYFNDVNVQLFDYDGEPISEEFRMNDLYTPGSVSPGSVPGFTTNPSIAMDDVGRIVVVWDQVTSQSSGVAVDTEVVGVALNLGENFVYATMDNFLSNMGSTEVSSSPITFSDVTGDSTADVGRSSRNPQVALDSNGNGVLVYESYADLDNANSDEYSYGIYYTMFDISGISDNEESNEGEGDEGEGEGEGEGEEEEQGATSSRVVTTGHGQANVHLTYDPEDGISDTDLAAQPLLGDQVNPSVAMDANGAFVITWNGSGAQPDRLYPNDPELTTDIDSAGTWIRWFDAGGTASSTQQRINVTEAGIQQFASVTMNREGDVVAAWAGAGVGDRHGVFSRQYEATADTAGPLATELYHRGENPNVSVGDSYLFIAEGDQIYGNPSSLLVVFDEELNTSEKADDTPGIHSAENVNNWALINGRNEEVSGAIDHVEFYFEATLNKWVAEVFFVGGNLENGTYSLFARTNIEDLVGNELGMTGYRPNGTGMNLGNEELQPLSYPTGGFGFQFGVNNTLPGDPEWGEVDQQVNDVEYGREDESAVARNASGDYVVAWVEYTPFLYVEEQVYYGEQGEEGEGDGEGGDSTGGDGEGDSTPTYQNRYFVYEARIVAQRFDFWGREIGGQIEVNTFSLETSKLDTPIDLAIDDAGNFVVAWSANNALIDGEDGIFVQRFDYDGDKMGGQIRANEYRDDIQCDPSVAMVGATGDFVVTWTSYGQDGNQDTIIARQYNFAGAPQGDEFVVNSHTYGAQRDSDVAVDAAGNFIVTWMGEAYNGGAGWEIYARRFKATGTSIGNEFRVNTTTASDQETPAVAMDTQGNFVVTWASYGSTNLWDIYARRYSSNGTAQGNNFRVNETVGYSQITPDVAMSAEKGFVITWASYHQDYPYDEYIYDYGIYARMYNPDGSNYVDTRVSTSPIGEFRVNAVVLGDQTSPAVSMDADGHYVVTWTGPNRPGTVGLFSGEEEEEGGEGEGEDEGDFLVDADTYLEWDSTSIYSRLIDPPIEIAGSTDSQDVTLMGTSGDDVIEFIGGPSANSWVIKVNGTICDIGSSVGTLTLDGLGGNDTLLFTGSSGNDSILLAPGSSSFVSNDYTVVANHIESITAKGGTGNNVVTIQDTSGDDVLTITPGVAELIGSGSTFRAENCSVVSAISTSGEDTVNIYDTEGNDTFTATPTEASMIADEGGYNVAAEGFRYVKSYSTGGTDSADLYDSAGDDLLVTHPTYARLSGNGFYSIANDFRYIRAFATEGDDTARMYDSEGDDNFEANAIYAKFSTSSYYVRADNFDLVQADGSAGGYNRATFWGTDGNDVFLAGNGYGQLANETFKVQASDFQRIIGRGQGGNDTATLYDTQSDDILLITSAFAQMSGGGCQVDLHSFEDIEALSVNGGEDTATLHDSIGEDLLEAEENVLRMSSMEMEYTYELLSFDQVTATSNTQGDKKDIDDDINFFLFAQGLWEDI